MEQNPEKEKNNKQRELNQIVNQPNECIIERESKQINEKKNNITEMREIVFMFTH